MPLDRHDLDKDGDHDPDACEHCIEEHHSVRSICDCGKCCESTIVEASLRDAEREPRIAAECGPIVCDLRTGAREVIGYMLNSKENEYACRFFDRQTRRCTIYDTRPLVCRVFDCDEEQERFRDAADADSFASSGGES